MRKRLLRSKTTASHSHSAPAAPLEPPDPPFDDGQGSFHYGTFSSLEGRNYDDETNTAEEMESVLHFVQQTFDIRSKKRSSSQSVGSSVISQFLGGEEDSVTDDNKRRNPKSTKTHLSTISERSNGEEIREGRNDNCTDSDNRYTFRRTGSEGEYSVESSNYVPNLAGVETTSSEDTAMVNNTCAAHMFGRRGRGNCAGMCFSDHGCIGTGKEEGDVGERNKGGDDPNEVHAETAPETVEPCSPFRSFCEALEDSYHQFTIYIANIPQQVYVHRESDSLSRESSRSSITLPTAVMTTRGDASTIESRSVGNGR